MLRLTALSRTLVQTIALPALAAATIAAQQPAAPAPAPQTAPPRPPTSVLGTTPAPLGVPVPGPVTDQPYAPQPILPGGIVVPLFPPTSPLLNASRIKEAEV